MLIKQHWQPQGLWQLLQLTIGAYIRTSVCDLFMIPYASCRKFICMQVNGFPLLYDKIFLLHLTLPYAKRCLFCPYLLYNYIQSVVFENASAERNDQDPDANTHSFSFALVDLQFFFSLRSVCLSPKYW